MTERKSDLLSLNSTAAKQLSALLTTLNRSPVAAHSVDLNGSVVSKPLGASDKSLAKAQKRSSQSLSQLAHGKSRKRPTQGSKYSGCLAQYMAEHHLVEGKSLVVQAKPDPEEKSITITPDDATVKMYQGVLASVEVPVRVGLQVVAAYTSATTQGNSWVWSPLASTQFTAFSALFSQYTIDKITFDWMFPWTSTAAVVATFAVAADPDAVSTSLTETEIINFPGYEAIYPATGAGSAGGRVTRTAVARSMLLASLPASSISNLGGWSPVGSAWPGQTITMARNINATAPGTETFVRCNQVWHLRFRNRFA